jgi:hypothetical protein
MKSIAIAAISWLLQSPAPEPAPDAVVAPEAGAAVAEAPPSQEVVPPAPPPAPPPALPPAPPAPPPVIAKPAAPPTVVVGDPSFTNGDVTHVASQLAKSTARVARCVADNGGLLADSGEMRVQFLVRVRGRAEGVEVLSHDGVDPKAGACVRKLLKDWRIGTPSDDPVGVAFRYRFTR